jgi:hypothetical protein
MTASKYAGRLRVSKNVPSARSVMQRGATDCDIPGQIILHNRKSRVPKKSCPIHKHGIPRVHSVL